VIVLAADGAKSDSSPIAFFLTLAIMIGAMYLLFIRPQRARVRAIAQAQSQIATGSSVVLTSGIYGTVVDVEEDTIGVEVAPGVRLKVARGAVARVSDGVAADADNDAPVT
jgi:preprotein translocase subunit YajC